MTVEAIGRSFNGAYGHVNVRDNRQAEQRKITGCFYISRIQKNLVMTLVGNIDLRYSRQSD